MLLLLLLPEKSTRNYRHTVPEVVVVAIAVIDAVAVAVAVAVSVAVGEASY